MTCRAGQAIKNPLPVVHIRRGVSYTRRLEHQPIRRAYQQGGVSIAALLYGKGYCSMNNPALHRESSYLRI
jgi:hypothetical protein